MLNSQNLIDKICACITAGGLTALQTCQLTGALQVLCEPVCSVASCSNLPTAADNVGRMIYVQAENRYYYAFDGVWLNDFQSTIYNYTDLLWSWGCNSSGQLGNNTTSNTSSPLSVVGGFTDWCQVSSGFNSTLSLRTNGSAWAWGSNNTAQIGDNTTTDRSSPVSVVGGFTDWCQVSTLGSITQNFSAAVRRSGSAWAWGANSFGQLGDGTVTSKLSPVSVVGGFMDWCQVSAGARQTVALRSSGSMWAWGDNSNGRLGDNTTTNRLSPVSVVGGFSDWCQASAGFCHNLAVRTNGTAWSWGLNTLGALGNNTTTNRSSPVSVVGGFTDWCQVGAGAYSSLAVRMGGSAWSWGSNGSGRLGDNSTVTRSSPVSVVGGFSDWCQISGGDSHSAAVRTNGSAWAWGANTVGQLGDGTVTGRSSPVSVIGACSDWCTISAGINHTTGLRQQLKGF